MGAGTTSQVKSIPRIPFTQTSTSALEDAHDSPVPLSSRFSLSALASTALGAVPQPLPMIRGIVVDPTGAPLPGAVVSLDVPGITTVTTVDGRFAITPGTPGKRRVRVTLVGYQPSEATVVLRRRPVGAQPRSCASPSCPCPGRRLRSSPAAARDYRWSAESASASTTASAATSTPAASAPSTTRRSSSRRTATRTCTARASTCASAVATCSTRSTELRATFTYQSARRRPHADGRHRVVEPVRPV